MSQHQAGSAGPTVKRLKQTALTWKAKNKATSQLARSDARLAGLGVNQREQGETVYMHTYIRADNINTYTHTYLLYCDLCVHGYIRLPPLGPPSGMPFLNSYLRLINLAVWISLASLSLLKHISTLGVSALGALLP